MTFTLYNYIVFIFINYNLLQLVLSVFPRGSEGCPVETHLTPGGRRGRRRRWRRWWRRRWIRRRRREEEGG